jgi:hypothetical protein
MKTTKILYRKGAPGGTRRRGIDDFQKFDHFGLRPPRGRLLRDSQKGGGNPEDNSDMRSLRRLPASIATDAVD